MNNYLNNSLQNSFNPVHRCNLNLQEHLKYVDTLVLLKIIDTQTGESIKTKIWQQPSITMVYQTKPGGI